MIGGFRFGEFGCRFLIVLFAAKQRREPNASRRAGGRLGRSPDGAFERENRLVPLAGLLQHAGARKESENAIAGQRGQLPVALGRRGEVQPHGGAGGVECEGFATPQHPTLVFCGDGLQESILGFVDLVGLGMGDRQQRSGVDKILVQLDRLFEEFDRSHWRRRSHGFEGLLI